MFDHYDYSNFDEPKCTSFRNAFISALINRAGEIECIDFSNQFNQYNNIIQKLKHDDTSFDAWQSLTDADKQLVVGVMEYQNNGWADIDNKYIPKASNYLLKRKFLDDTVLEPYESEIKREKAKIEQREYYQKAEQDSATPEEIKAILENALKTVGKQRRNNGGG